MESIRLEVNQCITKKEKDKQRITNEERKKTEH